MASFFVPKNILQCFRKVFGNAFLEHFATFFFGVCC